MDAWATFASGGGPLEPAFACPSCSTAPAPAVASALGLIAEARCRCPSCGDEWYLLMTELQALRLVVERPPPAWISWDGDGSRTIALSRGVNVALSLAVRNDSRAA